MDFHMETALKKFKIIITKAVFMRDKSMAEEYRLMKMEAAIKVIFGLTKFKEKENFRVKPIFGKEIGKMDIYKDLECKYNM